MTKVGSPALATISAYPTIEEHREVNRNNAIDLTAYVVLLIALINFGSDKAEIGSSEVNFASPAISDLASAFFCNGAASEIRRHFLQYPAESRKP